MNRTTDTCPVDYLTAEEGGEEPLVYVQIGQIEIDDTTFGVCTGSHLSDYAVCLDGHPSETVYTRDNIHTDEDRGVARAMIAAGYWHP